MTGWNLPPGCNVSDIPGNRPEDFMWENAMERLEQTIKNPAALSVLLDIAPAMEEAVTKLEKELRTETAHDCACAEEHRVEKLHDLLRSCYYLIVDLRGPEPSERIASVLKRISEETWT